MEFEMKAWGTKGELRVVVESPRGSGIKFKFDPSLRAFTVTRAFALGTTYPFDWGFIPGTRAQDGDPLDCLVLHDGATYPGIILPCKVLGMISVMQKEGPKSNSEANNRIIAMPTWHDRYGEFESAKELPERIKKEIETFFQTTAFFTDKKLTIEGWRGPHAATSFIKSQKI